MIRRLESAIEALAQECRSEDAVAALILFGSYSRGEYGRKSDVDLLLLLDVPGAPESSGIAQQRLRSIGRLESAWQLPMHLSPLLVSVGRVQELGAGLLHAIGRDGMVVHGQASALALLQPDGLMPWTVVTFSLAQLTPGRRAAASRRLHGGVGRRAVVAPPAYSSVVARC